MKVPASPVSASASRFLKIRDDEDCDEGICVLCNTLMSLKFWKCSAKRALTELRKSA